MQVVLRGQGENFCAGIDFAALGGVLGTLDEGCPGRARERLMRDIQRWQVQLCVCLTCRAGLWSRVGSLDLH